MTAKYPAIPRSGWTETSSAAAAFGYVPRGVAIHWNGPAVPARVNAGDYATVRSYLRAIRRLHVIDNGWSDIAYQWAVDQAGRRWELRGWRRRSAANGDTLPNRQYGAILAIIGKGQSPTPALLQGLRLAVADFRAHYPSASLVVGHQDVRPDPTECPGAELMRAIRRGDLSRRPDSITEEDDMTIAELIEALEDPRGPLARRIAGAVWAAQIGAGDNRQSMAQAVVAADDDPAQ